MLAPAALYELQQNNIITKVATEKFEIPLGTTNKNFDAGTILIAVNDRVAEYFDVYKLNINTGERKLFIQNPGNIVQWISDDNGNINLAVGSDGVNETIYFRSDNKEKFKPVITNNFKSSLAPFGFTNQANHIYALSNINRDKLALVDFDCKLGKEAKVIYENADADILDVVYSKIQKKLVLDCKCSEMCGNLYICDAVFQGGKDTIVSVSISKIAHNLLYYS